MRKLILHCGIHRTGTTSFQKTLANNRPALEASGYAYPGADENHQRWAWDILSGRKSGVDLRESLSNVSQDTILLSAEDFCIHKDLSWINDLKRDFDHIEAHFILRRQGDWLMSWYNQHVRWPFEKRKSTMSPMEFLGTIDDYYWLDYHWLGTTWAKTIGHDNVHMYPLGGNTVEMLARNMCPDAKLDTSVKQTNESTAPEVIEVLRHLNGVWMQPGKRARVIAALESAYDGKPNGRSVYPPAVLDMIASRFGDSNRAAFVEFVRSDAVDFEARNRTEGDFYQPALPDPETLLRKYMAPLLSAL